MVNRVEGWLLPRAMRIDARSCHILRPLVTSACNNLPNASKNRYWNSSVNPLGVSLSLRSIWLSCRLREPNLMRASANDFLTHELSDIAVISSLNCCSISFPVLSFIIWVTLCVRKYSFAIPNALLAQSMSSFISFCVCARKRTRLCRENTIAAIKITATKLSTGLHSLSQSNIPINEIVTQKVISLSYCYNAVTCRVFSCIVPRVVFHARQGLYRVQFGRKLLTSHHEYHHAWQLVIGFLSRQRLQNLKC